MSELIGVIAGTPIDTQMGVDFLTGKGLNARGYPISNNAKDQNEIQLLSKDMLHNKVVSIVESAKNENVKSIFVYCNSLSAAVDMDRVSDETDTFVVTPFTAYEKLGNKYSSLFILAANGQSCAKVESILIESNKDIRLWSLSSLPMVEAIETKDLPGSIFKDLGLDLIFKWVEMNKFEAIILACTHFPYLTEVIKKNISIPIIDPAEMMLKDILEFQERI